VKLARAISIAMVDNKPQIYYALCKTEAGAPIITPVATSRYYSIRTFGSSRCTVHDFTRRRLTPLRTAIASVKGELA
jgi:hypothetical protein